MDGTLVLSDGTSYKGIIFGSENGVAGEVGEVNLCKK